MSLYKPSSLKSFLDAFDLAPKKSFSQSFLIDQNVLNKIINYAHVSPDDVILEIGPGPGVLTEALLKAGATVVAIEKDRGLAEALKRFSGDLTIICADALKCDFLEIFKGFEGKKIKVISNLPYHLTSPLIGRLIDHKTLFSSLTVMVQKEVGQRMVAREGTKNYSAFSIFCQFHSTPHYLMTISPKCFFPAPKVHSCIIRMDIKESAPDTPPHFFPLIKTAFQHRRKMLKVSLKNLFDKGSVEKALEKIGLKKDCRPENLSVEHFISLTKQLEIPSLH